MEEIEKYKGIVSRLKIINSKLERLDEKVNSLKQTSEECIKVDEKILNEEAINEIKDKTSQTRRAIKESIIPSINRKTYDI